MSHSLDSFGCSRLVFFKKKKVRKHPHTEQQTAALLLAPGFELEAEQSSLIALSCSRMIVKQTTIPYDLNSCFIFIPRTGN